MRALTLWAFHSDLSSIHPPIMQRRYLLNQANQEATPSSSRAIIEMIVTIIAYKFETLSQTEVESMLGITLKETRVYREIKEEGERSLIIRQLTRRVGELSQDMRDRIDALPLEDLESLGEALLDFSSLTDLESWMVEKRAS
jgi:predicted transposase YdaD